MLSPDISHSTSLSVCSLASGSKGNATFISDGTTAILVDAGLSGIETERRLKSRGVRPEDLDAILVSHEHSDHISGVGVLSRRFNLPVYISSRTAEAAAPKLGRLSAVSYFKCGTPFKISSLTIHPFATPHDAQDPAGFTVARNGIKVGIATDLGMATAVVRQHLSTCALVILEANHDPEMLMCGPYPWHLKQRVKSRSGHLSNYDARDLLRAIWHDRLAHVVLGHLSEKNNTPHMAMSIVGQALHGCRTRLSLATQDAGGDLIRL